MQEKNFHHLNKERRKKVFWGFRRHLLDEVVKHFVGEVSGGDPVVPVDDGQLGRVLEGVLVEAEKEEGAAESPDIGCRVDGVVGPHVEHLWGPVHRRRVSGHLFFQGCALPHRPVRSGLISSATHETFNNIRKQEGQKPLGCCIHCEQRNRQGFRYEEINISVNIF